MIEKIDSLMSVDTAILSTFLTVARLHSFTAAATELHLVQSSVTSRVQSLEKRLKVPLFDRLPQGVVLTAAGRDVAEHAQGVLEAEQRLFDAAGSAGDPSGDVVIGAPESVCAYRLPAVIASLQVTYPAINVHLIPAGTPGIFDGLLHRRLDIGLTLDAFPVPDFCTSLSIGAEPIDLLAAVGDPATGENAGWAHLANYRYFLLEEGCSYSDHFVQELTKQTQRKPQVTRFGSIEAARSCVEAGLGLTVLPRIAAAAQTKAGKITHITDPHLPDAQLTLLTDGRRWISPAVRSVVDTLGESLQNW